MTTAIPRKPLKAIVDFICTTSKRRITTVPLYEGESLEGTEVLFRAQRHVELENKPFGLYNSNPFRDYHLYNATRMLVTNH